MCVCMCWGGGSRNIRETTREGELGFNEVHVDVRDLSEQAWLWM